MSTQDKVRIGVVGIRNRGGALAREVYQAPNTELVALVDQDLNRARNAADQLDKKIRVYSNLEDVLASNDIDAVILAVPNHLHAPMAIVSMEAGKHVLVEKPMACSSREAEAMLEARDRYARTLMVGMNYRFRPDLLAAKEMIAQGALGDIWFGRTLYNNRRLGRGVWGRGDWFVSKERSGGGPLIDIGIHAMDLALFLLGFPEVKRVSGKSFFGIGKEEARAFNRDYQLEDAFIGTLHLEGGKLLQIECSYFLNTHDTTARQIHFMGTKGSLGEDGRQVSLFGGGSEIEPLELKIDPAKPCGMVLHFANAILGNEPLASTGEHGLLGLQIVEALYASAERDGHTIDLEASTPTPKPLLQTHPSHG